MAYGVLYEFHRTSTNGADMLITISQKGYSGAVKKRALGRAPVIKRDNNGHIYGTSCELYAECLVDGEFSHLYTSDAYEYKVEVYKNNTLLWAGFVSPELYSEPDIAPPYDVQIIATDGLGELKNYNFNKRGEASILDHINALMANTGIDMGFNVVSGLRYIDEKGVSSADKDILSVKLDLDHEEGNSCYDVLQGILSSLNANITQHNGNYLIFRETDFISKAGAQGVEAFNAAGNKINLGVASFGTMKANQWWPVGQLSTVIEPAKNQIVLKSPNHYKGNVLRFDNWTTSEMASFSEAENAYILPGADSYITQNIAFGGHEVGYRLGLRVRARNVGSGTAEQNIKIEVSISGRSYSGVAKYFLVRSSSSGRLLTDYIFTKSNGYIEESLPIPTEGATSSDAQDIDVVLPLYWANQASYMYAQDVWVTISNPKGLYDIHVYDVTLVKYEQIKGYEANVAINNMAREAESDVDLTISAGDLAPTAGNVFMTGLPLRPSDSEVITKWQIGNNTSQDYLATMAFDYSRGVSLPKMKYSGILNVPGSATVLPTLFLRDGTYYFPHTYSYDLYSDEITVELISISAADVSLSSITISQTSETSGTMGTTTGGASGGGISVASLSLSGLRDVETPGAKVDDLLQYDGQIWKNTTLTEILSKVQQLGDFFYKTEDGQSIGTKFNLFTEKEFSANGLNKGSGGSGAGLVSSVLGATSLGATLANDNSVVFNAYATNEVYKVTQSNASRIGVLESEVGRLETSIGDGKFLPLSGGTIEGSSGYILTLNRTANSPTLIAFQQNGTLKGFLGISTDGSPLYLNSNAIYYPLIHSGNIGDYTDKRYLKLEGGTITTGTINSFVIKRSTNNAAAIRYENAEKLLGYIGIDDASKPSFYDAALNRYTLLHSGNIGDYALKSNGGTIGNYLAIVSNSDNKLILNETGTDTKYQFIEFQNQGVKYGALGTFGDDNLKWNGSILIHSGNIGSQRTSGFRVVDHYANIDVNTALRGGGITSNYFAAGSVTNAPSGSSYGSIVEFASAYADDQLAGQLAWDVYHRGTDTTRFLWWRASDDGGFANAKWHKIAFTDSTVEAANKLATPRTIWGRSFDGTNDITGTMLLPNNERSSSVLS